MQVWRQTWTLPCKAHSSINGKPFLAQPVGPHKRVHSAIFVNKPSCPHRAHDQPLFDSNPPLIYFHASKYSPAHTMVLTGDYKLYSKGAGA